MAISCGLFNSKGLDRTYTAEDFCDYLGSIICDGVQAPYGDCFALTTSGMTATIGTGKAWIKGHYFISNDKYEIDLKQYQDGALPRMVSIGIVLDTAEAVRDVKFEVVAGAPADIPAVPDIPEGGTCFLCVFAPVWRRSIRATLQTSETMTAVADIASASSASAAFLNFRRGSTS